MNESLFIIIHLIGSGNYNLDQSCAFTPAVALVFCVSRSPHTAVIQQVVHVNFAFLQVSCRRVGIKMIQSVLSFYLLIRITLLCPQSTAKTLQEVNTTFGFKASVI